MESRSDQVIMNIGIITFHWATNHGAILQAFALQKFLEENIAGANVKIIDYYPSRYIKTVKRALHSRHISMVLRNFKDLQKEQTVAPFRKKLKSTYHYSDVTQLCSFPPDFDVLISGSDQIWNEFFTLKGEGKPTSSYYLPFQPNARKISYAASFGLTALKPEMENFIRKYLEKFDAISMRETSGANIIKGLGLQAEVVCDPTALLPTNSYPKISPYPDTKYVAKYFLRILDKETKDYLRIAENNLQGMGEILDIENLSIEKWLGAICDSAFLITNSFHGVMFALKYHTPFLVIPEKKALSGMNDRFTTLLKAFCLEDRVVSGREDIPHIIERPIDWEKVDAAFESYISDSIEFLKDNCRPLSLKKSITLYKRSECCGCGTCVQICPKKCITFVPDSEGFLYPSVDIDSCIHCGNCYSSCPIKQSPIPGSGIQDTFVAYSKNPVTRDNSSSGGIFSELALQILSENGIVFGAALGDRMYVSHTAVTDETEIEALRGSKYVQSDTSDCFKQTKVLLESGKKVLYSGTPCQIAGLKQFLKKDYDGLYTVDIICHGVASPKVWDTYVHDCEQKNGSSVERVNFRNKESGWNKYSLCLNFENGQRTINSLDRDTYLQLFLKNMSLRPSCYDCAFKGRERVSDITIGDAWGIEHFCEEWKDDKGVTLVLIHSEKGKELFEMINNSVQRLPLPQNNCALDYNTSMDHSAKIPKERADFFSGLNSSDASLDKLLKKYSKEPLVLSVKKKVKALLKGHR